MTNSLATQSRCHWKAELTPFERRRIVALFEAGVGAKKIAERLNVKLKQVSEVGRELNLGTFNRKTPECK